MSYDPLYFCVVCCDLSIFIANFIDLISPFVSWWVWLMVCQFYLSFQRTSFWLCWFLLWSLFFSFAFISALIFNISFLQLTLGFFISSFSSCFMKTQMYRTVFWTLWERERVGWFGRMALQHVYYHIRNESPVQVQCRIQDAWGWCTGMTQRDGMGREVGGGFRIGNTYTSMADSCWCMAKPIQYYKVISLQLK